MPIDDTLLQEMITYYRERATEYDQWFLREGRYDRGDEFRRSWFGEVAVVEQALAEAGPRGHVLELACGTGLWTQHLTAPAQSVTAVDASPEVIELNKQRVGADNVTYVLADLFQWQPPQQYDFIFFGFWLSHVPHDRFDPFWQMVRAALRPGGHVFFVDSLLNQGSTARDHKEIGTSGRVERRLNDGRTFEIVKIFYEPDELQKQLAASGWQGYVRGTDNFFLYGCLTQTHTDNVSDA